MTDKKSLNTEKLVKLNRLVYDNIGDHVIVDSRTQRKIYARKSSYENTESIEFEFPTGSSYVYGPTSYLVFEVKADVVTGDATALGFGVNSGSAMNFFESMQLFNGEELERIDDLNLLSYQMDQWTKDNEHLYHGAGSVEGYRSTTDVDVTTSTRFCIPLSRIGGFFSNTDQLIPPTTMAGARLTLKLASGLTSLIGTGGTPTATVVTYTITNPAIMVDTFDLNDSTRAFLNKKASSKEGLIYTYPTWSHQKTNANSTTSVSSNVGIPVGHVLYAFTLARTQTRITDGTADSFKADAFTATTKWRYRLGSIMYPDQKVESSEETFMLAQNTFDRLKDHQRPNSVRFGDMAGGNAIMAMSFERSHLAKLSGLPLNQGGRSLYLEWSDSANTANLDLDTYMCYVKVVQTKSSGQNHVMS